MQICALIKNLNQLINKRIIEAVLFTLNNLSFVWTTENHHITRFIIFIPCPKFIANYLRIA